MSQEAAPDPAGVPEGDGPQGPDRAGASGACGAGPVGSVPAAWTDPTVETDPEDGSAADEEGLRWAALLAAFIDDMQAPPPSGPADVQLSPSAD